MAADWRIGCCDREYCNVNALSVFLCSTRNEHSVTFGLFLHQAVAWTSTRWPNKSNESDRIEVTPLRRNEKSQLSGSIFKDLSMMYRALWDRRHEGATRIRRVHWRIRVAPECLPSHNARYIMLKSDYDMNYLVSIHYEAEICKRNSEAGWGESCIVENLCMVV